MGNSLKSPRDFISAVNPQNLSGSIKPALELIKNLRDSHGNPPMIDAVGAVPLSQMLQLVSQAFFTKKSKYDNNDQQKQALLEALAALQKTLADLLAVVPQTPELQVEEANIQKQIDSILAQLAQLG